MKTTKKSWQLNETKVSTTKKSQNKTTRHKNKQLLKTKRKKTQHLYQIKNYLQDKIQQTIAPHTKNNKKKT